ncbi:hypothetical protein E2C01_082433 [Portunus trituberculatus]|uniref:Uncharacterized protein n=1 Tax=Portunus trituberculatus TaxID=210409 RepID=A0A5B7J1N0_PORTR|nr:hypothetical protein [Portunus trituberculatus]
MNPGQAKYRREQMRRGTNQATERRRVPDERHNQPKPEKPREAKQRTETRARQQRGRRHKPLPLKIGSRPNTEEIRRTLC